LPEMTFSQRKGYKPVRTALQHEGMDDALRTSLWNVFVEEIWPNYDDREFGPPLWRELFKLPTDEIPWTRGGVQDELRKQFFDWDWYEVYDFLEWMAQVPEFEEFVPAVNQVLEQEMSAYRLVGRIITEITDEQEVAALEEAVEDSDFPPVREHLRHALRLLSDRDNPDYRNSIKESISAVEAIARAVSGNPKATLGDALKILERDSRLHAALKDGFSKLYGYTSDGDGIRHAMTEASNVGAAEAKYFLLSCTSFINYLKSKMPA
jgi:Arc/MetJ-type ribon-helix-helix transcriptional regulator